VNEYQPHAQTLTIRNYLQIARRRKWTILLIVVTTVAIGVGVTVASPPTYSTTAKVLIGIGEPPQNTNQRVAPDRLAETQAGLAESPAVARRVLTSAGITDMTAEEFLAASSVKSNPANDILTLRVSDTDRRRATTLTARYAKEFIEARRRIDGGGYVEQVGDAFMVASPSVARRADSGLVRTVVLALALGLFAGILAAFLREGLDTRVRSAVEILSWIQLPLLARLPKPERSRLAALARHLRRKPKQDQIVMLSDPDGRDSEPFRVLRSNLDFFNMEHGARSIMITSAVQGEGKTTTAANLAVAIARTGRRVILVDGDLRRSALHRLFGLNPERGLVDAVYGVSNLDDVLVPVEVDAPPEFAGMNGDGHRNGDGDHGNAEPLLRVLPAGEQPRGVGEFYASPSLAAATENLKDRADVVIIDGPPLLGTGDAVAAAANVDAMAVVARVDEIREPDLAELVRVLETCRAGKLGVVITGLDAERSYGTESGGTGAPRGAVPAAETVSLDS
jgi:succinoglycan biosynthesis transport protein ExoP